MNYTTPAVIANTPGQQLCISQRLNGEWQSNRDMVKRREMIQRIIRLLKPKDHNASHECLNKLPQMVKQFEVSLYRSAPRIEAYCDESTLKHRLQQLLVDQGGEGNSPSGGSTGGGGSASGRGGGGSGSDASLSRHNSSSRHGPSSSRQQQQHQQQQRGQHPKQQKCGDGGGDDEAAQVVALGGPMYDEATARKMLKEVVLDEDEEIVGFEPDDAELDNTYEVYDKRFEDGDGAEITPMIYFAGIGDEKMCRYLISRGASTTKLSTDEIGFLDWLRLDVSWHHYRPWAPMEMAAKAGHLQVCKVLHANGAKSDIWKENFDDWTPIQIAGRLGHDEVVRWLVLQGALCADANSEKIQRDCIYPGRYFSIHPRTGVVFPSLARTYERLIEWADEVMSSHSSMVMFLLGTLPPAPNTDQSCILQCLSGHSGVRKHVADFVGMEVTKGKHLRILRNVKDVLPSFL